ncbi:MAG: hypothetical protein AAF304_00725 [Pseudomonadota bacterium]
MRTTLKQKHLIKGTTEYEIFDDHIVIHAKSNFGQESGEALTVTLAVLNPEPVITRSHLEFVSRVNGEPLLSLALSKPNVREFNEFVNTLKQKAQQEYDAISGLRVTAKPVIPSGNSIEEPPEFDEVSPTDISKDKKVSVEGVENAINMLKQYVNDEEIQPLITALTLLKQAPEDHAKLVKVASVFNELGSSQGAVLTYAPYITIMLSDDPFGTR